MPPAHPHYPPFGAISALLLPGFCVLAILFALDMIALFPALLVALAIILPVLIWFRRHLGHIALAEERVRTLAESDDSTPLGAKIGLLRDLDAALLSFLQSRNDQKQTLQERIRFYRNLLDSMAAPLFLLDKKLQIVFANQAAAHLFKQELRTHSLTRFLRNPALLHAAEAVIETGENADFVFSAQNLDMEFRAQISSLQIHGENKAELALSLLDVTALVKTEQMRADFVANASHELRTPLASILGFIETLQGPARNDSEAQEQFLAIMFDQASRMSRLIDDLLSLSRIELNEHVRPSEICDLAVILERTSDALTPMAQKRAMTIDLSIEATLPAIVGKEDELTQLFQNLIDNAIKYGKEGSNVSVLARSCKAAPLGMKSPALQISIVDQGEGIAREHLPRLTERFFRIDDARSRQMGGTGLGLAIVKHILARHRGQLSIESEIGKGSCFSVWLEAAPAT